MSLSKGTLFFPPKHKWLADIISLKDPQSARESVRILKQEFEKSGRARRRTILRAANLAANRAAAFLNKKNISAKEKQEFREIEKIYRRFVEWASRRLKEDGGE
jgi:hypothetical protein